jgi:hypothetical protein
LLAHGGVVVSRTIPCTISERGNGLPSVGDYVPGDDGSLWRVASIVDRIHTGQPGEANYIHATVELASWDDCEEGDEFPALAVLPSEHDADVRRMAGEE